MANSDGRHSFRSGAQLPLTLLVAVIGLAAGVVIWLTVVTETEWAAFQGPRPQTQLPVDEGDLGKGAPGSSRRQARDGNKIKAADGERKSSAALTPPARPGHAAVADVAKPAKPVSADESKPRGAPNTAARPDPKSAVALLAQRTTRLREARPKLPRIALGPPLRRAPEPGLGQNSVHGPLPIIGADGRKPWRVYARPFAQADKRPRVAIVISGLGLSSAATDAAIQGLPGAVTLAFAPYADRLGEWIRLARAAGHEVLLNVPMEPLNYPEYDPGPQALLTTLSPRKNHDRLMWTLGRASGYVGVADFMGSRFTMSREHLAPVLTALKRRGLIFLDSNTAPRSMVPIVAPELGLSWIDNQRFIDDRASREAIDERLAEIEKIARKTGRIVAMGSPYPVTLERVATWARELNRRGVVLAPVSALVAQGSDG